jgi:hypothetical protein
VPDTVSVTLVPSSKFAEQVGGHSRPPTSLVTRAGPLISVMSSLNGGGGGGGSSMTKDQVSLCWLHLKLWSTS